MFLRIMRLSNNWFFTRFNNKLLISKINIFKKKVNFLEFCAINNLLICGSEDGSVSFWELKEGFLLATAPKFVIYTQGKELVSLVKNSCLGIVVFADKVIILKLHLLILLIHYK